jgi:hypothetical protein
MTRDLIPLPVADLSAFTKTLSRQLATEAKPTHQTLMNMLVRAAGFRNLQHLHAARSALTQFDAQGQLIRWPARHSVQILCLWALWSALPKGGPHTEKQISQALNALHLFKDAAILRRDMVALGLLRRDPGGTNYARIEQRPPPEARALIARITARR